MSHGKAISYQLMAMSGEIEIGESSAVKTIDTVGCGDSFIAAFVMKMLEGRSPAEILSFAGKVAGYVSTKRGAMPELKL